METSKSSVQYRGRLLRWGITALVLTALVVAFYYSSYCPKFDDTNRFWSGLSKYGLERDLATLKRFIERGEKPINQSFETDGIWTDGDIVFYTRDHSLFDIEAICKLGPSGKLPHATQYGVARWIKRLEGDYYWVVLRN